MRKYTRGLFVGMLFGAFAIAPTDRSIAQDACTGEPETHRLMINVTNNVPTGVRRGNEPADDLYVCPGDTVVWIFQGRGFSIDFFDGTPFEVSQLRPVVAGRVDAVVRSDVSAGESYKYDISIDGGGVLDPRIIIQ